MRTYRDCSRQATTREELARLYAHLEARDAEGLLIDAGELEQGVLDALPAEADGWGEVERTLRALLQEAGTAYLAAGDAPPAPGTWGRLRAAVDAVGGLDLPGTIRVKAPEGFMHYALDPAAYAGAARAYAADVGAWRAGRAVVVGVRSIGTSLSAVVAAALGTPRTCTVRPRGASGARHVAASPVLRDQLAAWCADEGDVLIVDEGPGATGETFRCVAAWLEATGVAPERVVLLPSHTGGMSLAPPERRAWFEAGRLYPPAPEEGRIARVAARLGLTEPEDLSGGQWRRIIPDAAGMPACVHHERRKYRARDAAGEVYLVRYVGLGRWGRAAVARAEALAAHGAGPPVHGYAGGFLARRWVDGPPAGPEAGRDPAFRGALSAYLAARAGLFETGRAVDRGPVLAALLENAREVEDAEPPGLADAARRLEALPERPAYVADARLQAHEWIRTPRGYAKVDALDHGDGTRLPGPADAAWDLAGAAVEFDLDAACVDALVRRCAAAVGAPPDALRRAVDAYRAPYAACCLGEATLSAWESGGADADRMAAEAARYRRLLRRALDRSAAR